MKSKNNCGVGKEFIFAQLPDRQFIMGKLDELLLGTSSNRRKGLARLRQYKEHQGGQTPVIPGTMYIRRQVINKLKSSITGFEERKEEESDTSEFSDSNEEGEVDPSEDELTNVRYSESDTPTRTPISGPLEARLRGDPSSGPKNQKKGQHFSRRVQKTQKSHLTNKIS